MNKHIIMLVGIPASGKSFAGLNLVPKYNYIPHDLFPRDQLAKSIKLKSQSDHRPIVIDAPFNAAGLVKELEDMGFTVSQHLITAPIDLIKRRYKGRSGKDLPKNFETNHARYEADNTGRFTSKGTAEQLIKLLKHEHHNNKN